MSNKIRELNTIFNSFDLKGSKEKIADPLSGFGVQPNSSSDNPECETSIVWMKDLLLENIRKIWTRKLRTLLS